VVRGVWCVVMGMGMGMDEEDHPLVRCQRPSRRLAVVLTTLRPTWCIMVRPFDEVIDSASAAAWSSQQLAVACP
jgi:hypothetical protein